MKRLAVALVAVACVAVAWQLTARPKPPAPAAPAPRPTGLDAPDAAAPASLEEMRKKLHVDDRLALDRRFVAAFGQVRDAPSPAAAATATWSGDGWDVRVGSAPAAHLSEFADFPEAFDALVARARAPDAAATRPAAADPARPCRALSPAEAADALHGIDRQWSDGDRSAPVLLAAARAAASLALFTLDELGVADALGTRALALAARAAAQGLEVTCETAMTASALGYERAAADLAARLPECGLRDALTASEPSGATPEGFVAWSRIHAEETDSRWQSIAPEIRRHPASSLAWFLHAPWSLVRETNDRMVPRLLADARALTGKAPGGADGETSPLAALESVVVAVRDVAPAALGADAFEAALRAPLFSAAGRIVDNDLDQLSSTAAAERDAAWLGTAPSPSAGALRAWIDAWIAAERDRNPQPLAALTAAPGPLGAQALARSFHSMEEASAWNDQGVRTAAFRLTALMDSRPAHRDELLRIAWRDIDDLTLVERLARACVAVERPDRLSAWILGFLGDYDRLSSVASDATQHPATRAEAVEQLHGAKKLTDAEAVAALEHLLTTAGDDRVVRDPLLRILEKTKDYGRMREIAWGWLLAHRDEGGIPVLAYSVKAARARQLAGRPDEAWKILLPLVPSEHFGVYDQAAQASAALAEPARARVLARRAVKRYPGARACALAAEIEWRLGDDGAAAAALAACAGGIRMDEWSGEVGPRFVRVFAARAENGARAAKALARTGIAPSSIEALAREAGARDEHELAFTVASQLEAQGLEHLQHRITAYRAMKAWRGEALALSWLRGNVHAELLELLAAMAFDGGADEVVFALAPSPTRRDEHAEFLWLMKAAAARRTPALREANRATLDARFGAAEGGVYHTMGRFLLGRATEAQMLALAKSVKRRCEVAFYLGLDAEMAGRREEASDWYRLAVQTGSTRDGEHRWAQARLAAWRSRGLALSVAARLPR